MLITTSGIALICAAYSATSGFGQAGKKAADSALQDARHRQPIAPAPPGAQAGNIAQPPGAASKSPGSQELDWLYADLSDSSDKPGETRLTNWIYTREDMKITGSTGLFNRRVDTLDTRDPIVMDDAKHHITSDKAHVDHAQYDRSHRLVTLTGNVVMVLKPEAPAATGQVPPAAVEAPPGAQQPGPQSAGEDKDRQRAKDQRAHGGTAQCDKLEYKVAAKFSTLTGHVIFKQSFTDKDGKHIDRTLTCEHAENDEKANKMHLFKPVHYEDSEKQTMETPDDVFLGTKEGDETMTMTHVKFLFPRPNDEEPDNGKSPKPAPSKGANTQTKS